MDGYKVTRILKDMLYWKAGISGSKQAELLRKFKKDRALSLEDFCGYDQYNYMSYPKQSDEEDDEEGFSFRVPQGEKATKGQIARAFIKAKRTRVNERVILKKFIEKIAA